MNESKQDTLKVKRNDTNTTQKVYTQNSLIESLIPAGVYQTGYQSNQVHVSNPQHIFLFMEQINNYTNLLESSKIFNKNKTTNNIIISANTAHNSTAEEMNNLPTNHNDGIIQCTCQNYYNNPPPLKKQKTVMINNIKSSTVQLNKPSTNKQIDKRYNESEKVSDNCVIELQNGNQKFICRICWPEESDLKYVKKQYDNNKVKQLNGTLSTMNSLKSHRKYKHAKEYNVPSWNCIDLLNTVVNNPTDQQKHSAKKCDQISGQKGVI
eukprot:229075_1